MNELHEKFDSRGLTILGVTGEEKKKTEAYVKSTGMAHAYAYDNGGRLSKWFGVRGIPHAVLIDTTGNIVWRGHPATLDDAVIEKALDGALEKPAWTWPDEAGDLLGLLARGEYSEALTEAEGMEPRFAELVRSRIAFVVDSAKAAKETGDLLLAVQLAENGKELLAGLPEGKELAGLIRGLEEDADSKRFIEAQKELAEVVREVQTVRLRNRALELLETLKRLKNAHPDTLVDERATEEIADLERRLG